jgi:flagellar biosynthesis protein FlhB
MGPHVKEKGRVKGAQIGSCLMQITIKEAKVVIAGPWGISQAFSINEIVVELGG